MRYLATAVAFFLISTSAHAVTPSPSPETDLGLAAMIMVAGAAFIAGRRRRG